MGSSRPRLTRLERLIAAINLIYIAMFTVIAWGNQNYEFVLYAGVVVLAFAAVLLSQRRLRFEPVVLWGLTIWGLAHMAGGNVRVGDGVLYSMQLVPVVLRYDQLVHMFGFGTATLVCYHMLRPHLREGEAVGVGFWVLVALMGMGVGALNEIVEFVAVLAVPETGVGGYSNTLWDLVFNFLGALLAVLYLATTRRRSI